jgi:hypothetical protein
MEIIPEVIDAPKITTGQFVKLTVYNSYNDTVAGNFTIGQTYKIEDVGNTNWTSIGADSNNSGVIFVATGSGSGNGTAANVTFLTFSDSYNEQTLPQYIGNTIVANYSYNPFGGLLTVGAQNRELRVTSGDTSIAISGISGNNMSVILGTEGLIRGSELEIIRGFYNANMVLTNSYTRFTGIITNYQITEEREGLDDNFTITLSASSYKTVLENRIAGRKTNRESWQFFSTTDSAMNNINSIAGVSFDFGADPKTKIQPGYGGGGTPGGGGGGGGGGGRPGDGGRQQDK